jgi:hypothetical protein
VSSRAGVLRYCGLFFAVEIRNDSQQLHGIWLLVNTQHILLVSNHAGQIL